MSQSDLNIANVSRSLFRQQTNEALQALGSLSSGATEPTTTYAYQLWADTGSGILKQRNAANDGWISKGNLADVDWGLLNKSGGAMSGALQLDASTPIASGATIDLSAATGNDVTVTHSTGDTATTSFGAASALQAGTRIRILASISGGTLTLTHNATSMIIPGGADWLLADGDSFDAVKISDSQAYWRIENITLANGEALVGVDFASEAEYITGTDTTKALNPAVARAQNVIKGTSQSASGQSQIDFSGIPSWVTNIVIQVVGVSMSSTQNFGLQIGDSGGLETSGYNGSVSRIAAGASVEAAFGGSFLAGSIQAAVVHSGCFCLTKVAGTNTWACQISLGTHSANYNTVGGGYKTLSATLDRFSLIAESGTFDAGSFNFSAW